MDCTSCGTANVLRRSRGAAMFVSHFVQLFIFLAAGIFVWSFFGIPGLVVLMIALYVLGRLIDRATWTVEPNKDGP